MNNAKEEKFPRSTRVVIVGGGIMGCGLAYHLAYAGWKEVILFEKAALTSGSTWHAAGQITRSTSSLNLGKCVDYNIRLYSKDLENETGQNVSWHGCGSIRLAYCDDEADWLRHTLSVCRSLDVDAELLDCNRIHQLHPFYNLEGVSCGLYTPDDGYVDPAAVTFALAAGARKLGAKIVTQCRVKSITHLLTGEWCVSTELGDVTSEHVVNAGGTYARQIAEWNDLILPATSMTHHYVVTDTVPEFEHLSDELPVIRDDKLVSGYVRMEQKSGLIGIYEKENPNSVWEEFCPWGSESELFDADFDRIMPWLENAVERMPIFRNVGIKRVVHGAISHPPDGNPLIGPAPGLQNYWYCCGTQIGIGWGPALSRELARWIVDGSADISMREFDPRRFGSYAKPSWQVVKAKEDYCLRHEIPFPNFNRLAGRPIKKSPLYEVLKSKDAVFEEVYGHERPRWFARDGVLPRDQYSFRRNAIDEIVNREVEAVRNRVGIMDISAFTKIEVRGADAEEFLDKLVANKVPQRIGGIVLTHALNSKGRIEVELTLSKLDEERYYLVCAAFFEQRLLDHLQKHHEDEQITILNRSDDWAALTLQGPNSRDVLAKVTHSALKNSEFRLFSVQNILIAGKLVWASRISYTGELGWEIHGERQNILPVYEALFAAGKPYGIVNYGSFAMNVMRMEKMFKGAGELTNEVTLPEADVMRFVDLGKYFIGRRETINSQSSDLPWVCKQLSIESNGVEDGQGGEAVILDGQVVGSTVSVVYSPTVDKILAFAYIQPFAAKPDLNLEVIIAGQARKARLLERPVYDPASHLPRTDDT